MRRITLAEAQGRLGSSGNISARFAPSREQALREYAQKLDKRTGDGEPGPDPVGVPSEADESGGDPDVLTEEEKLNVAAAVAELGAEEAAEQLGLEKSVLKDATAGQTGNSLVRDFVEERLQRARRRSSSKLLQVLAEISPTKIKGLDAKELAATAKDLTTVITKLDEKKDNRKVIIIGEFQSKRVEYPTIDIKATPIST